jgi:pimeloyl-ACP methyl ester carboxylesterase
MRRSAAVSLDRRSTGSGQPLVLVHGTACDADNFRLLEPILARRFTVVTVNRRGRLGSPDAGDYSLEAEFEDVAAVVESLGEPVILFGHSFGANVALGAALRSSTVAKLILYEPGHEGDVTRELRTELERVLERGDDAAAMKLALREFTEFPEEWLDDLLQTPPWQERLAYAHTILRELRAYEQHDFGDLARLTIPTLLLAGSESPVTDLDHAQFLAAELPNARVSVLEGEGHVAAVTAPSLLAERIIAFAS